MKNLVERFGDAVTVLSHDNYYRRHDELTYEQRCLINYDEPAAFETDLMAAHLDSPPPPQPCFAFLSQLSLPMTEISLLGLTHKLWCFLRALLRA